MKQEPEDYSWDDLVRDGSTEWTGVRNFQARNNLRQMKVGDAVFFYHRERKSVSSASRSVSKAAYPDPTARKRAWVAVDIKPVKRLPNPVSLADIEANAKLSDLLLDAPIAFISDADWGKMSLKRS